MMTKLLFAVDGRKRWHMTVQELFMALSALNTKQREKLTVTAFGADNASIGVTAIHIDEPEAELVLADSRKLY